MLRYSEVWSDMTLPTTTLTHLNQERLELLSLDGPHSPLSDLHTPTTQLDIQI